MNPELVNLLISIDKNADFLLKKNSEDTLWNEESRSNGKRRTISGKNTPVKMVNKETAVVSKQDRRARRTLRAKVNCILNNLPEVCSNLSQKHLKTMKNLKKKKLDEINVIRKGLGKLLINIDDFTLEDSFDRYGNVTEKRRRINSKITPRSALRQKLSHLELEMLKEDPVYFIQNEKYKYTLKLNDDEDLDYLVDQEENSENKPDRQKYQTSKERYSALQPSSKGDEYRRMELSEKIIQKIDKAIAKKEQLTRQITKKFQDKFKNYSEKTLKKYHKEMIRINGRRLPSISNFETSPLKSMSPDYSTRLDKIKEYAKNKKIIEDRINNFAYKAREAERMHSLQLRENALEEKKQSAKKTQNLSKKKKLPIKLESPTEKFTIHYGS